MTPVFWASVPTTYIYFIKIIMQTDELQNHISLSEYTSWRVGGPAERLYLPKNLNSLISFLKTIPENEPLTWLGLGSNTLVREGGVKGTVIVTQACLNELNILDEVTIRAEAGVACPAFARFCARHDLQGLEFLAGIPGTIGGALAMNAGCHGGETWNCVAAVETVDHKGNRHTRFPQEYQIAYRSVKGVPHEWFVAGHFRLTPGIKEESLEKIRALLAHRAATQPTNEPSCGSVFRNPPGDYAARLIESCGLKGKTIGGAHVSTKHANFIVNDGNAKSSDIESLIAFVEEEVEKKCGVKLIREVHIIGEK
jgi:UDP-N-acetylmuramate dehydrogenase